MPVRRKRRLWQKVDMSLGRHLIAMAFLDVRARLQRDAF
jgi:hypothetical protein